MQDLWTAIIGKLKSDETYDGLVGNRTFYGKPPGEVTEFPAVRLLLVSDLPNVNVPGDYECLLQIDVTCDGAKTGWPVVRRIEDVLRFPTRENVEPIDGETYWLRSAIPGQTRQLQSERSNPSGGGKLVQLTTDWTLRVTRKN
jgi:hypothetical protein